MKKSAPLLRVSGLNVTFRSAERENRAVRDFSLSVDPGETVALVGESGSGKSISALSIMQLLPESAESTGSILYRAEELMNASDTVMRDVRGDDIAMIFQEPLTAFNPLHTIEKQIAESLKLHRGLRGREARAEILRLLDEVGIRDAESRLGAYPHQLSGGQRQRVMIAMALANDPDLLIADEPTTALDVTVQAQILRLLKDLQRKKGMGLILISHDLGVVRRTADRVQVMKMGETVESGPTDEVLSNPQHPYTQHLLAAEPSGLTQPVNDGAEQIIAGEHIRVWFPIQRGLLRRTVGHVKAVDDISLSVRAGETVGVVGESGSGKTTLGLALLRLLSSTGRIVFMGRDIDGLSQSRIRPLRRDMQIVFQDPYGALSPRLSIEQIIGEGLRVHGLRDPSRTMREVIGETLIEVGLSPDMMDRYPHEFSGGQRQRIAIARAMVLKPKLVLLDEPTSALDMSVQAQVVDLLRGLQEKHGLAYIFISHDLKVVRAMSHKVIVMQQGKVVEVGARDQIFDTPQTDYTKTLMAAALRLDDLLELQ